jgi:hypothetical protein
MSIPTLADPPFTVSGGVAGTAGLVLFPGGACQVWYDQTALKLGPVAVGIFGMDVSLDQTAAEGAEYVFDDYVTAAIEGARHGHLLGTAPVFAKLRFTLPTVANVANCAFGFRSAQAHQTALASYDDFATIDIQAGGVFTHSDVGGAGDVEVDTGINWLDGETHELLLTVGEISPGFVRAYFDGDEIGMAGYAFTGINGVYPFFKYVFGGGGAAPIWWNSFELGALRDVERGV